MSFVFTPYNTNREKDEDEDLYYDDVNIEDDIIQFTPKVQEISRLYEIHNNYEFDQGYIIEKKELWRRRLKVSIKNTIEKDIKSQELINDIFLYLSSNYKDISVNIIEHEIFLIFINFNFHKII